MAQASNTIYGDIVTGQTLNSMKRALETRAYALKYVTNVSQYATKGQAAIHVPYLENDDGQVVSVGAAFDAPSGDAVGSKDLLLNKKVGNPFLVKRDLAYQTTVKIVEEKSKIAAEHILESMDVEILKGIIGSVKAANIVDFSAASTAADTITKADFIAARKALNEANAPLHGRVCIIGPEHESQLMEIAEFVSADKIGKTSNMPIVEGFVGRAFGFDIVLLNHLPMVDKKGEINSTAKKNDSTPVIFLQSLAYMYGKQLVETNYSLQDLANADRYVPYNTFGNAKLEDSYVVMVCDKTTADPTS
ncbi:MAG: hypothetical protein WDA18_09290 [Candidatus Ratteibacteria bacterium]